MITPFKNVKQNKIKDAFNFFHSQVRINVECSFGKLVQRWSILRKAIPLNVSVKKTTALVMCLCKLHNFCINMSDIEVADNCAQDKLEISINGGVALEPVDQNIDNEQNMTPLSLLNGGQHFDDFSPSLLQEYTRLSQFGSQPRDMLLKSVTEQKLTRPTPKNWK